jgi:hypothetical protein
MIRERSANSTGGIKLMHPLSLTPGFSARPVPAGRVT